MIVTTTDGLVIVARDARHAVEQMRDTQWNAPDSKREYMEQVSERVQALTGRTVATHSPSALLADLQRAKLLIVSGDDTLS